MKRFAVFMMFIAVIVAASVFFAIPSKAQCPTSHAACCPMAVPDSLSSWQTRSGCFAWTCGNGGLQDVADVPVDLVYHGWTRLVFWGHTTSADAEVVVMSQDCDSILVRKCIAWPADSVIFYNGSEAFTVWVSSHDTALTMFWTAQPVAVIGEAGWQCELLSAYPPQIDHTYRSIDLVRGTVSEPSATVPAGISLRSDGMKVLRQGVPSGLVLIFAAIALGYIIWNVWKYGDV